MAKTTPAEALATSSVSRAPVPCPFSGCSGTHPAKCRCGGSGKVIACEACGGAGFDGKRNRVCDDCAGSGCMVYKAPAKIQFKVDSEPASTGDALDD